MKKQNAELNTCAEKLVAQLPDHIKEMMFELTTEMKVPFWQYVDGLLLDAYYSGRLSSFQLDPSWRDGFKGAKYVCKNCETEFKPKRIGQIFCAQDCATAFEQKELTSDSIQPEHTFVVAGDSVSDASTTANISPDLAAVLDTAPDASTGIDIFKPDEEGNEV